MSTRSALVVTAGDVIGTQRRERGRRIVALDAARGIAIIGMIGAHTLTTGDLSWLHPTSWAGVVHGRSSILFAVLGGVSLALATGRDAPPTGQDLVRARLRVLVRAWLLFLLGGVLAATAPDVSVILQVYAVLFAVAVPVLSWPTRRLLAAAALWAIVAPVLTMWLSAVLPAHHPEDSARLVELMITGTYPGLTWITFVLVGLAIGRSDLDAARTKKTLVSAGAAGAIVGYGGGWLASRLVRSQATTPVTCAADNDDCAQTMRWNSIDLSSAEPHTGTTFEILGSVGIAAALIGLLVLSTDRGALRALVPVVAIGSMPLTVYTAHVLSLAFIDFTPGTAVIMFAASVAVAAVAASIWRSTIGQGPLEQAMTRLAHGAADNPVRHEIVSAERNG